MNNTEQERDTEMLTMPERFELGWPVVGAWLYRWLVRLLSGASTQATESYTI